MRNHQPHECHISDERHRCTRNHNDKDEQNGFDPNQILPQSGRYLIAQAENTQLVGQNQSYYNSEKDHRCNRLELSPRRSNQAPSGPHGYILGNFKSNADTIRDGIQERRNRCSGQHDPDR